MNSIKQFWNKFKAETDIWFFYGFLLTFPFSIRKVITLFPIRNQFNEYSGIYLYLSDILLILTLLSWLIILYNKYGLLSIATSVLIPRHKLWTKHYPQFSPKHFSAYLGLILVLWSFLSIIWSDNQIISLFQSLKLLEFFVLAIYVTFRVIPQLTHTNCSTWNNSDSDDKNSPEMEMFHVEHFTNTVTNVPRGTFLKDTFKIIILGGIINSVLAIWQFITQHSIGLTFLKESIISPNIDGVAKILISGHKLIRIYGFFPHPNILGGFLLFSIVLTIYYRRMFHVEHFTNTVTNVPRGTFSNWQKALLTIQAIALILTFSRSAIIGLIITLLYISFLPWIKCSTWNISIATKQLGKVFRLLSQKIFGISRPWMPREKKDNPVLFHVEQLPEDQKTNSKNWHQMFHVEQFVKLAIILFFTLSVFISVFLDLSPIKSQSLDQREMLSNVPRGTILDNPILGLGQGQLIWSMRNNPGLLEWQFQPVHNVFLLIWSELGIVGLILFIWLLWKMFHVEHSHAKLASETKNVPRGTFGLGWNIPQTQTIFKGILLGFIFIMLFDHYLWDIQQGQIMLWLVFGLLYSLKLNSSDSISP